MRGKLVHKLKLLVRVRVWGWVRVTVEFGLSSAFRGWVRVRVLGVMVLECGAEKSSHVTARWRVI